MEAEKIDTIIFNKHLFEIMEVGGESTEEEPEEVLSEEELLQRICGSVSLSREYLARLVPMAQERMEVLSDFFQVAHPFLVGNVSSDPSALVPKGRSKGETVKILRALVKRLAQVETWNQAHLEESLREQAEKVGWKTGDLFMAIRVSVSGSPQSPPLFEMMDALGRDLCLDRLRRALDALQQWRE